MRQLLVYNGYASGGARAYSLGANSYTQIGDIIGSVDAGPGTYSSYHGNSFGNIAQIQDTIYVLHSRTIKKKNSDGSWSTVASLVNPFTGHDAANRMIPCVVNGVTYLVVVYMNSSTAGNSVYFSAAVYNTQTGILSTSAVATNMGYPGWTSDIINITSMTYYNGTVYTLIGGGYYTAKLYTLTVSVEAGTASVDSTSSMATRGRLSVAVFNNELWCLATNAESGSATYRLWKRIGGAWVSQYTVATLSINNSYWKPLLFTDGTYMYAILESTASSLTTWRMYRCTTTSATEITTPVLTGFSGQNTTSRWHIVCDQHANPENPEYILLYRPSTSTGSTNSFYRFVDSSTALQFLGSAGEGGYVASIATPAMGGGELMFRDGEMHIEYIGNPDISDTPGNMTLYFRIYESSIFPSGSPVHVRMFSSSNRNVPTTPCRLANPQPIGSIENSYTITGITCGSGVLYSVDWRAAADGYNSGDSVTMVASVSGVL